MATITDFLNGFSFNGLPVIQSGNIDPTQHAAIASDKAAAIAAAEKAALEQQYQSIYVQNWSRYGPDWVHSPRASVYRAELDEIRKQIQEKKALIAGAGGILGKYGLTESSFQYNTPAIYARLLQSAEQGGGYLSSAQQSRELAATTAGVGSAINAAERSSTAQAAQAGLNPIFASQSTNALRFNAISKLFAERARVAAQQEERKFNAQKAFADMLASTAVTQQQERTDTIAALQGADMAASAQRRAGRSAMWGQIIGGALGSFAGPIGTAIGSKIGSEIIK